jgi:hypothetical protein
MSGKAIGLAGAGYCAECGDDLAGARHGWITVQVAWRIQARVHTTCRAKFEARPFDEQKRRASLDKAGSE